MGEYENLDDFKCSVYTGEAGACPCFCAAVFSGITRHAAAAGAGSAKVSSSWDPVIILARGPLSLWVKTKPEMTPNARYTLVRLVHVLFVVQLFLVEL